MPAVTLAAFLRHQRLRGLSPRTVERRAWSLGAWVSHVDGDGLDVPVEVLEDFLARYRTPATRHAVLSDVRALYAWAGRRRMVSADPTVLMEAQRVPRRLPTPVRPEDVRAALAASSGDVRTMILLAAHAGLRVSEVAGVCGRDVQPDRGLLVVRQGKGGKDREVPMSAELARALRGVPSGPLFPGVNGDGVRRRIKAVFARCGIDARAHDLRASFATQLARKSAGNVVAVAALMGHESVATTERYMGWTPELASLVEGLYDG